MDGIELPQRQFHQAGVLGGVLGGAGFVDQHVDAAVLRPGGGHQGVGLGAVGHVNGPGLGGALGWVGPPGSADDEPPSAADLSTVAAPMPLAAPLTMRILFSLAGWLP